MREDMLECSSPEERIRKQVNEFTGSLKGDLVAVIPDGSEEKMMVSKNVLYNTSSEYIVKTVDGWAKERAEQTIRFLGWKSDIVELFLFWAYRHTLPDFTAESKIVNSEYIFNRHAQTTLARVWLFGDAFSIPKLQNSAMKQIVGLTKTEHTSWEMIQLCWQETTEDENFRPLRKFAVDQARADFFVVQPDLDLVPWEMEILGKMPGFLTEFLKAPKELMYDGGVIRADDFKPVCERGWEEYAVEED